MLKMDFFSSYQKPRIRCSSFCCCCPYMPHSYGSVIGDTSLAYACDAPAAGPCVCRHARTVQWVDRRSLPACHFGSAVGAWTIYDTAGSRTRVCFQKRRHALHSWYICIRSHELNKYCSYRCLHLSGCSDDRSLDFTGAYVLITSLVSTEQNNVAAPCI